MRKGERKMTILKQNIFPYLCTLFALTLLFAGCSGGGGGADGAVPTGASTGKVTVSLTDAPTTELDHVWVTVKEIRFHRSNLCDDLNDSGWQRYPLATPLTLDLTTLNNGIWSTLWNGIVLPIGNYQQIRVILAGTGDTLTDSAVANGLSYNNQVNDNGSPFPLIIPAAKNGIKLIGSFQVTTATPLHIVVDFDITHDVVETGSGKYILKPRLKYCAISTPQPAAAITGRVFRPDGTPFANYTGVSVDIQAEALEIITFANNSLVPAMGIVRSTMVRPDGTFALYPLPTATPWKAYDLIVRGTGMRNMILRDVPAEPGTTKDDPPMFAIDLIPGSDYPVGAQVVNANTFPYEPALGAMVGFYQTPSIVGGIPYLISLHDVDTLSGSFGNFSLAKDNLLMGTFNPKALVQSFSDVEPVEGTDNYAAYASAPFFWPSGPEIYSPVYNTFSLFLLTPQSFSNPPECDVDDDGESDAYHKGYYVTCGGLIVDHILNQDLEEGNYEFQSSDHNGNDKKWHQKNQLVDLSKRKPVRIKFKK